MLVVNCNACLVSKLSYIKITVPLFIYNLSNKFQNQNHTIITTQCFQLFSVGRIVFVYSNALRKTTKMVIVDFPLSS